jgi:hypothetical protein
MTPPPINFEMGYSKFERSHFKKENIISKGFSFL